MEKSRDVRCKKVCESLWESCIVKMALFTDGIKHSLLTLTLTYLLTYLLCRFVIDLFRIFIY